MTSIQVLEEDDDDDDKCGDEASSSIKLKICKTIGARKVGEDFKSCYDTDLHAKHITISI